jgi:hypothetical protein
MDLRACDHCCVSNLLCVEIKLAIPTGWGGLGALQLPLALFYLNNTWREAPAGCCNHPWCGTPLLVSNPVGLTLDSVVEGEGWISADEALHCCYGCPSALQSAVSVGIQHRDINSEHVMWVTGDNVMSITMCWQTGDMLCWKTNTIVTFKVLFWEFLIDSLIPEFCRPF